MGWGKKKKIEIEGGFLYRAERVWLECCLVCGLREEVRRRGWVGCSVSLGGLLGTMMLLLLLLLLLSEPVGAR